MAKASQASLMPRARPRKAAAKRDPPGGPGGMAALRRAQEKLKAMGIKPWKPAEPPRAKRDAPASPSAPPPAPAPSPARPSAERKQAPERAQRARKKR